MIKPTLPKKFSAYILTQSLGAFNDNFFKMLLQLYVLQILLSENAEGIISKATFFFTVPFVLFGPWSGYLADKYSKTSVMRVVKFAEIGIMLLGALAFYFGDVNWILAILFLTATQSTFFSPAKYGYIPEACLPQSVTKANGVVEMSTFLAIILGTAVTGLLLTFHNNQAFFVSLYSIVVAVLGSVSVLSIKKIKAIGVDSPFPWNPISGIYKDLRFLKRQKPLFLAALANSYFWMMGLIFQTNILIYAKNILKDSPNSNILLALMPAFLGIGIAVGSILASRWSGNKVELGLVPLGGLGMSVSAILLYFTDAMYGASSFILFFAGVCGGLFIVPLYAYLQSYSKKEEKGRVMATAGILNGLFLVLGSLIYHLLAVELKLSASTNYLILGIMTFFAVVYICTVIPEYFVRFCLWLLTHTFYKIEIVGSENVPLKGPALLAANHVSYIDAFLLGATVQRFIRFIMLKSYYDLPLVRNLLKLMFAIPIDPGSGRESVNTSLMTARKQLRENHVVCIFPEGQLTRHGEMNRFRPGFKTIMQDLSCPIIPIYMDNAWGSIFSFEGEKFLWKRPKKIPYPITISFGKPLPANTEAQDLQAAVQTLAEQVKLAKDK